LSLSSNIPFFGVGWEGVPNTNHGLYQATTGPAQGTWKKDGIFDFDDLQNNYIGTYLRFWDAEAAAPWLYNPDTQIMMSYDDAESLGLKDSYVESFVCYKQQSCGYNDLAVER
jgi:chitinase